MKKISRDLKIVENIPKGYSTTDSPTESEIWDKLVQSLPSNSRFLKYIIDTRWVLDPAADAYIYGNLEIPRGMLIYKLNIYYEEK